jgi:NAD(P)-dependent dehydrogenase (short-subunit alcohol dehydrogenase family)
MTPRHALITGAARGIGAAIARALAADGATVTLLGRNRDSLRQLQSGLPRSGIAVADITQDADVRAAFEQARAERGPIAILVNNAGAAESAPFHKTSADLWQRMLAVNLTGAFHCTQAALPDMLAAKHGRIVNVASTAGLKGYAYVSAYVAAKHGLVGLTRALALELAAKGITVNAVCPGYTETDIVRDSIANVVAKTGRSAEEARAEFARVNPQGRLVQPQEVADAVRWLCSDAAAAVSGCALPIAGGEVS